jgi:hypothetical protein
MAFSSLQKDFRQQGIYDMSKEGLDVATALGWHHVHDKKSVNSPNHFQVDLVVPII